MENVSILIIADQFHNHTNKGSKAYHDQFISLSLGSDATRYLYAFERRLISLDWMYFCDDNNADEAVIHTFIRHSIGFGFS